MLNDLQRLFQRSLAAFRAELGKREPEDQVAELLTAMRRELAAARAALAELRERLQGAQGGLARERELLVQCERRRSLAERIGDEETVRVAEQFAERHRERVVVLEQKVRAAEAELALREREAEEMKRRYQEADANRFAILAQLRQAETQRRMRNRLDGNEGAFADFARMEEAVEDATRYAEAVEELHEHPPGTPPPTEREMEARLAELKRRMGREG